MRVTVILATLVASAGIAVPVSNSGTGGSYYDQAKRAVCHYFKSRYECATAMQIVKCETGSTYWPWVSNGQYLGIFQMGSRERAIYGHGPSVWQQAKAAYAYYKVAGFYSPWLKWQPPGCGG